MVGLFERLKERRSQQDKEAIEQQQTNKDSWLQWASFCIKENKIRVAHNNKTYQLGTRIPTNDLYASYVDYCRRQHIHPIRGHWKFGKTCSQPETFGPRVKNKENRWSYRIPDGEIWQERINARLGICEEAETYIETAPAIEIAAPKPSLTVQPPA
jgi:phage/plasmid-associated DNA primase